MILNNIDISKIYGPGHPVPVPVKKTNPGPGPSEKHGPGRSIAIGECGADARIVNSRDWAVTLN